MEHQQLFLHTVYKKDMLKMTHDAYDHQGVEHTTAVEGLYWKTVYWDVVEYAANCP